MSKKIKMLFHTFITGNIMMDLHNSLESSTIDSLKMELLNEELVNLAWIDTISAISTIISLILFSEE